jgi:tRNA threonylcarbamoyladenosine biosynthesis protein TsaE
MILSDEAATASLGGQLARLARPGDVITLSGPLGVGKTALARGFIAALGHQGDVPSPSFAIVQPYEDLDPAVWHVDLYRIEDRSELEELGLDSASDAVLLVEWPERAHPAQWPDALRLNLDFADGGARRLTARVPPAWEGRWPAAENGLDEATASRA